MTSDHSTRLVVCDDCDRLRDPSPGELEADRLRAEIEEYLLWEPGRKGHAAAHARLKRAVEQNDERTADARNR